MILVTGAAGFIGHHLIPELVKSDRRIYGIDLRELRGLQCDGRQLDIRDDDAMGAMADELRGRVTECVHLAAIASPPIAQRDPATAWATNVQGTHNVLKLCQRIGCRRIVFMSSAHVYGISPRYMPTDETHPLALHDTYTTTKILGEQLCRLYWENHGIQFCTLRLWNAYGPGQSPDYFLGVKLRQAKAGQLTIRNERVTKDWVAVSDVVRAIDLALDSDYVGELNVGTGVETSLGTIVAELSKQFGVSITDEHVPDEGPTRMRCDNRRIRQVLGWEPRVLFQDGLAELIAQTRQVAA